MDDILGYFVIGGFLIIIMAILYLPIFFILRKRINAIRQLSFLLFSGCCLIILSATIFIRIDFSGGYTQSKHLINLVPMNWINMSWEMGKDKMITQIIANIIMFIPFGFMLPTIFPKVRSFAKTTLCSFAFTFLIEFTQYFIGGSSDIDDIILNLIGGIFGYWIFYAFSIGLTNKKWWLKFIGKPL